VCSAGVAASPVRAGRLGVLSGATAAPCGSARWLLYAVLAAWVLPRVGGFQTVREMLDARAFPMPGQLIDIGGHRLHLHCTGSGSPTVVLEPGHGATCSDLGWIAPAVASDTKVCVYDRAGRGWSDAADGPQDAAQIAADLHTLLARADVGPHRWPHTLGSCWRHWRVLVWLLPSQASPARRDGQFPANRRPLRLVPASRFRDGRRPD